LTVTICHALADADVAGDLQRYLLENLGGEVCRRLIEENVREAVDYGLSGDRVIVLLSPGAEPRVEDGWEETLLHENVFYLWIRSSHFPPRIARNRHRFTDARTDRLSGQRKVKRWLLGNDVAPPADVDEELCREVADKPGWVECGAGEARRFAAEYSADFERVIRIDGRGRTVPSIKAEMAQRLGEARRVLIVLEGATSELASVLERPPFASVLNAPGEPACVPDVGRIRSQLVAAMNHHGEVDEAEFDRAIQSSKDPDFVRPAVSWLEQSGRLAEAVALLERILEFDPQLYDLARKKYWLMGAMNQQPPMSASAVQMELPFDQR
jgi:hypothetical protein